MEVSIIDNFLTEEDFKMLQSYCKFEKFEIYSVGDKEFLVLPTPESLIEKVALPNHDIVLSFIRKAHAEFDTDWRIHADNIINGYKTNYASVLYIDFEDNLKTGTAFWEHNTHGKKLKKNVSEQEFNRLITEDANDLSKWEKTNFVEAKKNRFLVYDSNLFHSKYPNVIEKGERIVLVTFYKKSKHETTIK